MQLVESGEGIESRTHVRVRQQKTAVESGEGIERPFFFRYQDLQQLVESGEGIESLQLHVGRSHAVHAVESGEGIERRMLRHRSILTTQRWNPVKELKATTLPLPLLGTNLPCGIR